MKRGVILAGGWGTRMQPATFSTNKHLLPVYTSQGAFPLIEYPLQTLKNMGCSEILIITSKEHCGKIVDYLGDGYDKNVSLTYKIQEMNDPSRPPGIASALKLCEEFTGDDPFVVILGDNYYQFDNIFENVFSYFEKFGKQAGIFLTHTDEWDRFGIAEIEGSNVKRIVEKPTKFISNLAVTGMYIYTKDVYIVAKTLKPSDRGELEITDINNHYANKDSLLATVFSTFWSDMGTPESIQQTMEFINNE